MLRKSLHKYDHIAKHILKEENDTSYPVMEKDGLHDEDNGKEGMEDLLQ